MDDLHKTKRSSNSSNVNMPLNHTDMKITTGGGKMGAVRESKMSKKEEQSLKKAARRLKAVKRRKDSARDFNTSVMSQNTVGQATFLQSPSPAHQARAKANSVLNEEDENEGGDLTTMTQL
jgi:hypothetical protein